MRSVCSYCLIIELLLPCISSYKMHIDMLLIVFTLTSYLPVLLCILETPNWVLLQRADIQMKCRSMQNFFCIPIGQVIHLLKISTENP